MTEKEQVWLNEYLKCWNATEAARRAAYKWPEKQGPQKLQKFADVIAQRIEEKAMSADEVLTRLADHARSDFGDALVIDQNYTGLDLQQLKDLGLTHLIKKFSQTKNGTVLEFYDAQAALVHLGRHHGLFVDRHQEIKDGDALTVVNWDEPKNTD